MIARITGTLIELDTETNTVWLEAGDIAYELVAMTLLSLILLATGTVLYQRLRMRTAQRTAQGV